MKNYEKSIIRAFKGIDEWTLEDFRTEWKKFEQNMKEAQKILKYIHRGSKKTRKNKRRRLNALLYVAQSINTHNQYFETL